MSVNYLRLIQSALMLILWTDEPRTRTWTWARFCPEGTRSWWSSRKRRPPRPTPWRSERKYLQLILVDMYRLNANSNSNLSPQKRMRARLKLHPHPSLSKHRIPWLISWLPYPPCPKKSGKLLSTSDITYQRDVTNIIYSVRFLMQALAATNQ